MIFREQEFRAKLDEKEAENKQLRIDHKDQLRRYFSSYKL